MRAAGVREYRDTFVLACDVNETAPCVRLFDGVRLITRRVARRPESRVLMTPARGLESLPTAPLLCTVDTDLPDRPGTVTREEGSIERLGALFFLQCMLADRLR